MWKHIQFKNMFLNSVLGLRFQPIFYSFSKRNIRPTIKLAKDKFQLTIDVRQFNKDEIRVKARPEYVIIEGKQERKTKTGFVMRQFVRKFKLPQGCDPQTMQSKLSADGLLTVTAPRKSCLTSNLPCETLIPISEPKEDKGDSTISVQNTDPCNPKSNKPS
ncbi:protein lethal(2)essential for life-like [Galleria mellonella]|uniref:Protein lethal(2)essential for life-like n=1 Tax=Galleria mellonella TaxID=7137 RepID=A0ABM3MNY4_GALME|nr:protein lethal(2)essential for life-like [Galleria mellonella]